jgi:hypothetical protein
MSKKTSATAAVEKEGEGDWSTECSDEEDLDDTASADERDLRRPEVIPQGMKVCTNGYLKDGFVVSDDEEEEEVVKAKEKERLRRRDRNERLWAKDGGETIRRNRRRKKEKKEKEKEKEKEEEEEGKKDDA